MLPQIISVFVIAAVVQKCTGMYWSIRFSNLTKEESIAKLLHLYFSEIFSVISLCRNEIFQNVKI